MKKKVLLLVMIFATFCSAEVFIENYTSNIFCNDNGNCILQISDGASV